MRFQQRIFRAETTFLFAVPFVVYLVVGSVLVFGAGSVPIDTWARVGNAHYAMFSRDPHLAAIGFVLSPLPTIAIMPLLPFKALWPALVTDAFAANITTAFFMAAAVVQLRGFLGDLGTRRAAAWMITALFAAHPMIVYYGSNGLTEALFVLSLVLTVRHVARWLVSGDPISLAAIGASLAIGYLTRYEAITVATGVLGLVFAVSYVRARLMSPWAALHSARGETIIAALPIVASVGAWAFASWLIIGSPFPHFTSAYGNSAQLQALRPYVEAQTGQGTSAAVPYLLNQLLGLQPGVLALLGLGALAAVARRDVRLLGVAAVFGPVIAFAGLAFLRGATVGFLRYEIAIVPLGACLAGIVLGRSVVGTATSNNLRPRTPILPGADRAMPQPRLSHRRFSARAPMSVIGRSAAVGLVCLLLAAAIPSALATMRHPLLAREESDQLRPVLSTLGDAPARSFVVIQHERTEEIARDLDDLDLPAGSVLVDVALANSIVLQSQRPTQFVITTDRDFELAVADPAGLGLRYMLVASTEGLGAVDALGRAHPGLYETGVGIGRLIRQYGPDGIGAWRLFAVVGTS